MQSLRCATAKSESPSESSPVEGTGAFRHRKTADRVEVGCRRDDERQDQKPCQQVTLAHKMPPLEISRSAGACYAVCVPDCARIIAGIFPLFQPKYALVTAKAGLTVRSTRQTAQVGKMPGKLQACRVVRSKAPRALALRHKGSLAKPALIVGAGLFALAGGQGRFSARQQVFGLRDARRRRQCARPPRTGPGRRRPCPPRESARPATSRPRTSRSRRPYLWASTRAVSRSSLRLPGRADPEGGPAVDQHADGAAPSHRWGLSPCLSPPRRPSPDPTAGPRTSPAS